MPEEQPCLLLVLPWSQLKASLGDSVFNSVENSTLEKLFPPDKQQKAIQENTDQT